jgi:hypothetical protein
MATAGGPASIITQVSQGTGAPINALAGKKARKAGSHLDADDIS